MDPRDALAEASSRISHAVQRSLDLLARELSCRLSSRADQRPSGLSLPAGPRHLHRFLASIQHGALVPATADQKQDPVQTSEAAPGSSTSTVAAPLPLKRSVKVPPRKAPISNPRNGTDLVTSDALEEDEADGALRANGVLPSLEMEEQLTPTSRSSSLRPLQPWQDDSSDDSVNGEDELDGEAAARRLKELLERSKGRSGPHQPRAAALAAPSVGIGEADDLGGLEPVDALSGLALAPREQQHVDSAWHAPASKEELGRATWTLLHTMAAQFPEKPSRQLQRDVKTFMNLLPSVYPCRICGEHFKEVMKSNPPQVGSRDELEQYMCRIHNVVNRSLNKPQFPCKRVAMRWGSLECDENACEL